MEGASVHIMTGIHGASLEDYIASELPADVDVIASIRRCAAVLTDRIRHAYPDTSVDVRCDLDVTGSLPWDGNTYILDPLPDVVDEEVARAIDALRESITDEEWLVYLPIPGGATDLHVGMMIDHHALSLG